MTAHELVATFTVPGEPVSKARARFTAYGSRVRTYTPEKTLTGERRIAAAYTDAAGAHEADTEHAYGIVATFHCGTRQRRDVDNMLKLVLDGLNRVAFGDDNQVTEVTGRKAFVDDRDDARTVVDVYRLGLVYRRTKPCEHCGEPFETWRSTESAARFCSPACRGAHRVARRQRTCEHCAQTFTTDKPGQVRRWCSEACRVAAGRVAVTCARCGAEFTKQRCHVRDANYCTPECNRAAMNARRKSAPKGACEQCGGPVTKATYKRCRGCRQGRPAGAAILSRLVVEDLDALSHACDVACTQARCVGSTRSPTEEGITP